MGRNRWPQLSDANNNLDNKESRARLARFRRRLVEWMPWNYCHTMARTAVDPYLKLRFNRWSSTRSKPPWKELAVHAKPKTHISRREPKSLATQAIGRVNASPMWSAQVSWTINSWEPLLEELRSWADLGPHLRRSVNDCAKSLRSLRWRDLSLG